MKRYFPILLIPISLIFLSGCAERQDAILPGGGTITWLSETPTLGVARDVAVVGDTAYVADYPFGITVWDIADPANPTLIDTITSPNLTNPTLLEVDLSGRVLAIFDSEDPANLQFYDLYLDRDIQNFFVGSAGCYRVRLYFENDSLKLWRSETDGDGFSFEKYENIGVGDTLVFDPQFATSSHYAGSTYGFAIGESNRIYACQDLYGFITLDCSAFTPLVLGQMNPPGRNRDAGIWGNTLYLASGNEGLQTVDVSDPANPVLKGSLKFANAADVNRIEVYGSWAFLMDDNDGIFLVDASNPSAPTLLGSLETSDPNNFCVYGTLVLVADNDMGLVIGELSGIVAVAPLPPDPGNSEITE